MTTFTKSGIAAALAFLVFFPDITMGINCPVGIEQSIRVEGKYYVDMSETVVYTCVLNAFPSGGTYTWSINGVVDPSATGSSLTWTAPAAASAFPGEQTISCTYVDPSGVCTGNDSIAVTVLQTDGLVAYYPFVGNADDESGNGFHGTVNGATLTDDHLGNPNNAYDFDGVDDRIVLPEQMLNIERINAYSFSFWIKTDHTGNNIIAKMLPGGTARGVNVALVNNVIRIQLINDAPNEKRIWVEGSTVVNNDVWHHILVTYDGSATAAGVNLYIDGTLESNLTVVRDNLSGTLRNAATPTLGSRGAVAYYKGSLDDVRVYNRVLDTLEITDLSNSAMDMDGDGLTDLEEVMLGTDPFDADSDDDGMTDGWEVDNGLNPLIDDASLDMDMDDLSNFEEFERQTDPNSSTPGIRVVMPDADQYRANEPDLSWTDLP